MSKRESEFLNWYELMCSDFESEGLSPIDEIEAREYFDMGYEWHKVSFEFLPDPEDCE